MPGFIRTVRLTALALLCLAPPAHGGQSLQKGFYSHEPAGVGLSISNAGSGPVCNDPAGQSAVCGRETRITVTGQENCTGTDGKQYPCTRYGYQYDYAGAVPGATIDCESTRKDAFNQRSMSYSLAIEAESGHVFFPSWIPYQPVQQRMLLTEVHNCSYQGHPLTTIEFIVSYEPGSGPAPAANAGSPAPGIDEPYFDEIPDACSYLTGAKAAWILDTSKVQEGQANEHIGNLWSQCTWSSINPAGREVGFVFKFMLYEMFDVANLDPMQLRFNVTFASGGQEPTQRIDNLGKASFVFTRRNDTTLMVITGIQGPPDGANRPREFIANYYLKDKDRSHATRLEVLREYAQRHLEEWHAL